MLESSRKSSRSVMFESSRKFNRILMLESSPIRKFSDNLWSSGTIWIWRNNPAGRSVTAGHKIVTLLPKSALHDWTVISRPKMKILVSFTAYRRFSLKSATYLSRPPGTPLKYFCSHLSRPPTYVGHFGLKKVKNVRKSKVLMGREAPQKILKFTT